MDFDPSDDFDEDGTPKHILDIIRHSKWSKRVSAFGHLAEFLQDYYEKTDKTQKQIKSN